MRGLAIGGEEDCGMSTYTQWVGVEVGRKKVSDYIHACFCCGKGVRVPLNPCHFKRPSLSDVHCVFVCVCVCVCENTYV